jgi:glycosyltransferase involved in cell wall biosynthesis
MKLTVAVVAYGSYRYLDEAVASIARQTRPPPTRRWSSRTTERP